MKPEQARINVAGKNYFCEYVDDVEHDGCNQEGMWEIRTVYHDEGGGVTFDYYCDAHVDRRVENEQVRSE